MESDENLEELIQSKKRIEELEKENAELRKKPVVDDSKIEDLRRTIADKDFENDELRKRVKQGDPEKAVQLGIISDLAEVADFLIIGLSEDNKEKLAESLIESITMIKSKLSNISNGIDNKALFLTDAKSKCQTFKQHFDEKLSAMKSNIQLIHQWKEKASQLAKEEEKVRAQPKATKCTGCNHVKEIVISPCDKCNYCKVCIAK